MDGKTIIDAYGAKLKGQQLLWEEPDYILRNTPFKSINPEFDREAIIHWWMHVYVPDGYGDLDTPYEVYKTWSNALYPNFKYCKVSGYCPDTNQSSIKFSGYRNDPLEPQIAELEMWLQHVKEAEGGKYIGIFESTLSEHGSYFGHVEKDVFYLKKTTYGYTRVLREFKTLEEFVEYIIKHHPYE